MRHLLTFCLLLSTVACNSKSYKKEEKGNDPKLKTINQFSGNYGEAFNDFPDVQLEAAQRNGIEPLETRADTSMYMNKLVRLPKEIALYKIDKLTYSIPFLVTNASNLLTAICIDFRDSLLSKNMMLYKPIVTSVMRTNEDVEVLRKRNINAVDNSTHCYGTTFDISWKRFENIATQTDDEYDTKLKLVLAQVLNNLRERELCYVKYERKQACFHITVR